MIWSFVLHVICIDDFIDFMREPVNAVHSGTVMERHSVDEFLSMPNSIWSITLFKSIPVIRSTLLQSLGCGPTKTWFHIQSNLNHPFQIVANGSFIFHRKLFEFLHFPAFHDTHQHTVQSIWFVKYSAKCLIYISRDLLDREALK